MLSKTLTKTIFLDRDGVINHPSVINGKSYPPHSIKDFALIDGVEEALKELKSAGFLIFVITNQPDVGKGICSQSDVEEIHDFILNCLPVDDVFVCYHIDEDQCDCRKPLPGLLHQAAQQYPIDFNNSFLVGDRWKDIEAGQHMGCITMFIDYGYTEKKPKHMDYTIQSLFEAKNIILGVKHERNRAFTS